ncbi:MAG TPA: VIT domain-containing protein, partial [Desulfuromonadaceae bacterium]|nr:VIT domain-containing protein [Desulfuromonadaceae bacterium]
SKVGRVLLFIAVIFGVLLPVGTLGFEMFTGASAGVLFDPIPTWFHVAAVALVPAVNLWLCRIIMTGKSRYPRLAGWLGGAAVGIATFYSLLYLPFAPFACVAVIYFGLGLIPLAPYVALICAALLRRKAKKCLFDAPFGRFWPGFAAGLGLLVLSQVPAILTFNGLARAASDEPAVQRSGIATLRHFGDQETLLRFCYGWQRDHEFDVIQWLAAGNASISADQARQIYFRVTGRPFNSVPPPALYTRLGRWNAMEEEFSWDEAVGGEAVAGRVKGLSLQSSRMDAVAEPDSATVYCEWTLEFKNVSSLDREARAQISLPPGGVVSRLTLWVNGEEREAAFSGRSHVREAYQQVAVVQRHDPVLVTTCGPDRVLMQCFPVPRNGGTMKVRLGITTPLALDSTSRGRFTWPDFLERNFRIDPQLKHALWIESSQKMAPFGGDLVAGQKDQRFALHGAVKDEALGGVSIERSSDVADAWTPSLESDQVIQQHIIDTVPKPISKIVFVIDGSADMEKWKREIAGAIAHVPGNLQTTVIVAGDEPVTIDATPKSDPSIEERLQRFHFTGGRDNVPSLERGWDVAEAGENNALIWIHAAQPVLLSSADALRQRLERSLNPVRIYDLQLKPGPDRIAEKLDGLGNFAAAPRFSGSAGQDLESLFDTLAGRSHAFEMRRERIAGDHGAGKQVSRHIERLWARDEANRLAEARRQDEAAKLAATHQLVTAFSGAVVLENKQQYASNNLTPADPLTVPAVPEPGTWALLFVGGILLAPVLWRRRRSAG